tara:strand:+ start:232 stop:354 length:123 start_codon:yes stop_codon:yes gene_type:complete
VGGILPFHPEQAKNGMKKSQQFDWNLPVVINRFAFYLKAA